MDARANKRNDREVNPQGRYVLYWIRANRRAASNHALAFAVDMANGLGLPVLAVETLTCAGPYASDRLHAFALQGVPGTAAALHKMGVGYSFHLERKVGGAPDPVTQTAVDAAAVVTDDHPLAGGPDLAGLGAAAWAVDSSCVVPSSLIETRAYAAYSIRPKLRKLLPQFLAPARQVRPLRPFRDPLPAWNTEVRTECIPRLAASCDIDHSVRPSAWFMGGRAEAATRLRRFLEDGLRRYAREKNEPAAHATSDLSPYLRFGFISALETALAVRDYAEEHKLMADEFLEELIVRRELAFNFARHARRLDSLDELPEWARATLKAHRRDRRSPVYTRDRFESAATEDDLWNAAQKELLLRGKIHGYYRMYWGKKILEWSASPEEALATALYLNDRYALDGRDPNSYANILWCFGLHDRPWPQRPIYGTVRSMSRAGMERKTDVKAYIQEIEQSERI